MITNLFLDDIRIDHEFEPKTMHKCRKRKTNTLKIIQCLEITAQSSYGK